MWKSEAVERALFRWDKWRCSVIREWARIDRDLSSLPLKSVRDTAKAELRSMVLPLSPLLELYWIAVVTSDYNIDRVKTYGKINVPAWLPEPFDPLVANLDIRGGIRANAPLLYSGKDIELLAERLSLSMELVRNGAESKQGSWLLLPNGHELWQVIKEMKGRPSQSPGRGRLPIHSDRLAIKCAVLRDRSHLNYVDIAKQLEIRITMPYFTKQSDLARHLVEQGRRLIDLRQVGSLT